MRAKYEDFKLGHSVVYIHGKVGVHVVVILNCVRRPSAALHHQRVVGHDAIGRIIGHGGVFYDPRVPNVRHPQTLEFGQRF